MKKNNFLLTSALLGASFVLSLIVTACAAPATAPSQPSVVENTALPTETESFKFTPIPTYTATAEAQTVTQPTSELPPASPDPSNKIKFNVNGTYTDITDAIALGSSKTYTVNAMKGQIMSISVLPQIPDGDWGYIPMQISGADGSMLCPQPADSECMFWRGVLPTTQDYFVTLTPNGDVPQFIMRVAINPPGKDAQNFHYNNPASGVSLIYPDTFAPAVPVVTNNKITPELTLHFIDSKAYDKTNLSEAYLAVSSSSDAQTVAVCTEPNQGGGGPEQIIGNKIVNGFTFVHSTSESAGAGNYYQQEIYRMVNQNVCYEVVYFIHYTNIGNYTPGTVTEFDSAALMQKLDDVFATFIIN